MFNTLYLWIGAMAWHLGRIVTYRPAFNYLSDSKGTAISFIFIFYMAGFARWYFNLGGVPVEMNRSFVHVLINMTLVGIIYAGALERRNRSSALLFVVLGASAAVDFLAIGIERITGEQFLTALLLFEYSLYGVAYFKFKRLPDAEQQPHKPGASLR